MNAPGTAAGTTRPHPSPFRIWISAARPRTLPAALTPVVVGTAIAIRDGVAHPGAAIVAALGAILIQIGTNFANDYFDFVHGADTADRVGPTRATQAGFISPATMKRAFVITFALAIAAGVYLIVRGGWPVLAIGLAGILAGILYTGGPRPLGYLGLGDVLVLVFFGPVAVGGTYYVQALRWDEVALLAGLGPGLLSTALLAVNNLRDVETDRRTGKGTLAVRLGPRFVKAEFAGCVLGAAALPVVLWRGLDGPWTVLLATLACLTAIPLLRRVRLAQPGDGLLDALSGTGRLLVLYGITFAVGWIL